MTNATEATRPEPRRDLSPADFEMWYWPVAELRTFCDLLGLPASGRKHNLRARVAAALGGEPAPAPDRKPKARFNWARADLTEDTIITEGVSFGPNLRGFFTRAIGPGFVCHGDFMDWVKANAGQTLGDAITAWHLLEARKSDPAFRREIAECNNYLQYLRDIRDAHPELSLESAKSCWMAKSRRPAPGGTVRYEASDLALLNEGDTSARAG